MSLPAAPLALTDEDRAGLGRLLESGSPRLAGRARIVLACAEPGSGNSVVAADLGLSAETVRKWRARFAESGLGGLADGARPGRPKAGLVLSDAEREQLSRWARRAKTSHLTGTFKLSSDPLFVEKVVDVVGLYHNPPEKAVVLCVDEKSGIQALDRSQPVLPMMPGVPERRSHDYARHGTTDLFAAFNIADGTVISELHRRHRAVEFRKFLISLDKAVPAGLDVHLVCDNLATHKTPAIRDWLDRHPRFRLHFTPTGSSWINQVERWFGLLTDQKIRRGVHKSVQALEADIRDWTRIWNEHPRPFKWIKTADEILDSLAKYIAKISGAAY
jgi:transposase